MTNARDQIIEKTCNLLELQGYHATGLNQIVQESGSPKGSLYYYFPGGKEELTAEALNYVGQLVLNRIKENLAFSDDPAEAISAFILNIGRGVVASDFRTGGPITTVALETAATNERLREVCQQIYDSWQAVFEGKLISNGYPQEQAEGLAALVIAAIEGGIILCRTKRSSKPLEQVSEQIGTLIRKNR
ncbi:MAG: TetR/AcrR family transcriptional regulator [Burkholderiales bacterium]|nr:TetR/AcrR family transcriptional regulator [Anaerolineae bacterium]